eukprot:4396208-Pleurochrysis_carterae.AAC.1
MLLRVVGHVRVHSIERACAYGPARVHVRVRMNESVEDIEGWWARRGEDAAEGRDASEEEASRGRKGRKGEATRERSWGLGKQGDNKGLARGSLEQGIIPETWGARQQKRQIKSPALYEVFLTSILSACPRTTGSVRHLQPSR